ncbi:MAG: DUF362 domain-containing protein [Thermoguttaceae bacterium]|nr:DUF362 domain-containing protein [Thermoguttaceae bacterium]MDW8077507.1 DUF362 domain-containing protein [Thermoguttaceae bacterium]
MVFASRRDFLLQSAAAAAVGTVGAQTGLSAQAGPNAPAMAIAQWKGPKAPTAQEIDRIAEQLTIKAIEAIGGISRFVRRGDVVWVKPNIAWIQPPEMAANTNPAVVATIVRLCFEAGAKQVKVGDNPVDVVDQAYERSGIPAAVRPLGAQVVIMDRSRFRRVDIKGERLKSIPIYPEVLDADLVINVPIAKHHSLATITVAMKNFMGVVEERRTFHQAIGETLTDLTRFLQPKISVVDAVRVLVARGPRGGRLEDVRMPLAIAAGTDIVALDAWAAEILGRKPEEISSVVCGHKAGLGTMDYRSLKPVEIAVA